MPQTIRILGWERFQHYRDRDPPWVKLYRDLLTSESWVLGTDASRLVQVASILLAARYRNATSLDYDLFRKVANLDMSERDFDRAIEHLRDHNFLEIQGDKASRKQPASKTLAKCSSETEAEAEGETEAEENSVESRDSTDRADPVATVFDHWRTTHNHPRAQLDAKRRKVIQSALKTYTPDVLCEAISGYLNSQHHMGMNDRNTRYDDIELFLRDAKHIDAGLAHGRNAPVATLSTLTRKNIAATQEWSPPEVRNAS